MSKKPESIWEGVYQSFTEAGGQADIYEDEAWINKLTGRFEEETSSLKSPKGIPAIATFSEHLLPFLACLQAAKKNSIRVLDFGGGFGTSFFKSLASMVTQEKLEYHVVELPLLCAKVQALASEYPGLHFHKSFPDLTGETDIVHVASSLHYVENWRSILDRLIAYQPQYFLFSDLMAGEVPTFVTTQKYYNKSIPVWFWNLDEFTSVMENLGYTLVFRAHFKAEIFGAQGPLPMNALPEDHRIEHSCHLLFQRDETS